MSDWTDIDAIYRLWSGTDRHKPYVCRTNDLELMGIYAEDIIVVDTGDICRKNDVALVLIQTHDGKQKTTFRYFDPPYLMTKTFSTESDSKPLLADGETVQIVGRAVGILRTLPR
jgi:hypothetical protein